MGGNANTRLTVYVPSKRGRRGVLAHVAPESGIVGYRAPGNRCALTVYYEGADHLRRWADRVASAAGRLRERYPTHAKAHVPITDLIPVGEFDGTRIALNPHSLDAVRRWLPDFDETDLEVTSP